MTQEWANQLLGLGYAGDLPLSFDRVTGAVDYTLGQLGPRRLARITRLSTLLDNTVAKDNRIPP